MDGVNFSVAYFIFQEVLQGPVIQGLIIEIPSLYKTQSSLNIEFTVTLWNM